MVTKCSSALDEHADIDENVNYVGNILDIGCVRPSDLRSQRTMDWITIRHGHQRKNGDLVY